LGIGLPTLVDIIWGVGVDLNSALQNRSRCGVALNYRRRRTYEPMNSQAPEPHEPAEHTRFAAYTRALEQVAAPDEPDLIRRVLADPDQTMAQSAIVGHIDRQAAPRYLTPAYDAWAQSAAQVTADRPFLAQRLREWTLLRAIALNQPWDPSALTEASNWLQLKIAETPTMPSAALTLLAAEGRTKRIRHTARTSLQRTSNQ
jgi:hypothetical protein